MSVIPFQQMQVTAVRGKNDEPDDDYIIADQLRENKPNFRSLELCVDDLDALQFEDLAFSFRFNYTLRRVTLLRAVEYQKRRRSVEDLYWLVEEIIKLPGLESLSFENFEDEENPEDADQQWLIENLQELLMHHSLVSEYGVEICEEHSNDNLDTQFARTETSSAA